MTDPAAASELPGWTLTWLDGGHAVIVQTDGNHACLTSSRPAAPGMPLTARVPATSCTQVQFKVRGCRRDNRQGFELLGRWVNLSKAARLEMLESLRAR